MDKILRTSQKPVITIRGEFLLCACLVLIAAMILKPQRKSVAEPAKRVVIVLETNFKGVQHEQFK